MMIDMSGEKYKSIADAARRKINELEKEREEYAKERVWEDCKHGRWLSPCPICAEEKKIADLKRANCSECPDWRVPKLSENIMDSEGKRISCSKCPYLKQKCMFCGCTDDHACPGGCSWIEPNVCSRCKDRLRGNDLISGDEIKALRNRAKTITMKDGLRLRMQGGFVPVIPMDIKSGYGISLTIVHNPPDRNPIEIFSVGARHGMPDPADSESIATAVLGKGYSPLPSLIPSSKMVHFFKRRE